jgi:carboxyl-terminal processing protease
LRLFSRILISAVILIGVSSLVAVFAVVQGHRRAAKYVCELVEEHYYRSQDNDVQVWLTRCRAAAAGRWLWASRGAAIEAINESLQDLGVSHLFLYTPVENRELWDHEAVDTGLRARNIEGRYVIYDVLEGSAGESSGLKRGDVVLTVNGYDIGSSEELQKGSGSFEVMRGEKTFAIEILATPLIIDQKPRLTELGPGTGLLKIESLLARYFDREDWAPIALNLVSLDHVILDLRGNPGGSFPAMVRVASAFFCEPTRLGTVFKPRNEQLGHEDNLNDDLAADSQLDQLDDVAKLHLRTFPDYPCFDGAATVLVDGGTSSVAEILAESFYQRRQSRVWGMPTAGQVVMAQWFQVPSLGGGDYSVSIPIAGYQTRKDTTIEEEGLVPERLLYYDLTGAMRGNDSWIEEALGRRPSE